MHLGSTEAVRKSIDNVVPKGSLFSSLPGSYAGLTELCVKGMMMLCLKAHWPPALRKQVYQR